MRRGYAFAFHGGGWARVLQCNDTHLHQQLSALYQDIEMADLLEQARLQPWSCPKRDLDDCIRDAIAAWNSPEMHLRADEGHKHNMLSVALDGSEDHLGRGDAARLWMDADMPRKRAAALADVDARWAVGALTWDKHRDLIAAFPQRGQIDEHVEGQEDEGEPPTGVRGPTGRMCPTTPRTPMQKFGKLGKDS